MSAAAPTFERSRAPGLGIDDARSRAVGVWLVAVAILVFIMVIVGGATRLTGSGLSITEWRPVTGAIPPLSVADWLAEFEKYRQSPQYALLNQGMDLAQFKFIYWWEWGHRQLGRFIGLAYAGGLAIAAAKRWVSLRLGVVLFLMGLLLAGQGAIGWIMVASGLQPGMIAVAPVKLTLHLGLATVFFASLVYVATRISPARVVDLPGPFGAILGLWTLVFLQVLLGGLVAGSRAGLVYNTWPLMDGALIPEMGKLFVTRPWLENFIDNPTLVQFNHRMLAYGVLGVALWQAFRFRQAFGRDPLARRAAALAGMVAAQVALGIATLLLSVPLWAGLAHQALAILIVAKATYHLARAA